MLRVPKLAQKSNALSAEDLAHELGRGRERRVGRSSYRVPCVVHGGRSLEISEKNGKTLFHCWAGCSQDEVLAALRSRGLWRPGSAPRRRSFNWAEHLLPPPVTPSCCFEVPHNCEHWQQFDTDIVLAELHKNLVEAADEIVNLYRIAGYALSAAELREEIELAVSLAGSAITPWNLDPTIVKAIMEIVVVEVGVNGDGN